MAKALKPLIIILLVLSIAALVLGVQLFNQREVLKGRTQKLEQGLVSVAAKIRQDLNPESLKNYASMDKPIETLTVQADVLYEDLQNTKQDLENTRDKLADTQRELDDTIVQLNEARTEIAGLNKELDGVRAELAQALNEVQDLKDQKVALQAEVQEHLDAIADMEEEKLDLDARYRTLEQAYNDLVAKWQQQDGPEEVVEGVSGMVLFVNPDWNFVILNVGTDEGLKPSVELLVHRQDKLVGRVRVSNVKEGMAVADIIGNWSQDAVREGDHVISPKGKS